MTNWLAKSRLYSLTVTRGSKLSYDFVMITAEPVALRFTHEFYVYLCKLTSKQLDKVALFSVVDPRFRAKDSSVQEVEA